MSVNIKQQILDSIFKNLEDGYKQIRQEYNELRELFNIINDEKHIIYIHINNLPLNVQNAVKTALRDSITEDYEKKFNALMEKFPNFEYRKVA